MCVCVYIKYADMSFGCDYVKYVCRIKIREMEPWFKNELLKTATYNVWQTAYGRICCNSFSPTRTRYTEIEGERKSPENGYELDRLSVTARNYKVGSLSEMLPDRVSFVLLTLTSAELFGQKALGFCHSGPSFCAEVVHLYLLLSSVWWQRLFHWNVKTRDRTGACVCVCRRSWLRVCLAELASTPGLASRLHHMVTFIMYLAIH